MFLWLKTLYRKRAVTWPFIFYTIIWTLSKNPQRRLVYENIVKDLNEGIAISKIAKKYNVTRQTIYRIKKELI